MEASVKPSFLKTQSLLEKKPGTGKENRRVFQPESF